MAQFLIFFASQIKFHVWHCFLDFLILKNSSTTLNLLDFLGHALNFFFAILKLFSTILKCFGTIITFLALFHYFLAADAGVCNWWSTQFSIIKGATS